jgi:hypothetical protein
MSFMILTYKPGFGIIESEGATPGKTHGNPGK